MYHFLDFLHKHLVDTSLSAFFIFYIIVYILDSRFGLINRILITAKRLAVSKAFLVVFFLFSFLVVSFFSKYILQEFQNTGSEYAYIFQAQNLYHGKLWAQVPRQDFFSIEGIVPMDGKDVARVFPGWPFLLTAAMFLHIPLWLVNPILATLSLLAAFLLGKLIYNETIGLLSAIAILFSPFYIFNAASFVPHISCALFILLAVYFFCSFYLKNYSGSLIFGMGICLGASYLIRPFSTFACLVPLLAALMIKRKSSFFFRDIWYFLLGMAPFLLINYWYNFHITGNAFLSPFNWTDPQDTIQFHRSIILENFFTMQKQFLWMNPAIFIMYFFTIMFFVFKRKIQAYEFIFLILMASCFFYFAPGVSYGARYYYEGYSLCMITVLGRLSRLEKGILKRLLTIGVVAGFFISLMISAGFAKRYRSRIHYRNEVYRLAKDKGLSNAIVFLPPDLHTSVRDARNDPDLHNAVLYAHDLGRKNFLLKKDFPTRVFWRYIPEARTEDQRLLQF